MGNKISSCVNVVMGDQPPRPLPNSYMSDVINNVHALMAIPRLAHNEGLCYVAVCNNGLQLEYVRHDLKNEYICAAAIRQNAFAIMHAPVYVLTADMCISACRREPVLRAYVPEELLPIVDAELGHRVSRLRVAE